MAVCKKPGCISESAGGELCPVHLQRAGKVCALCAGTGYMGRDTLCSDCAGVGLKDAHKGAPKARRGDDDVDSRGLIVAAGESSPGPDAVTLLESATKQHAVAPSSD